MAVISDDHLRELIAYADARETLFMTEPANIAALAKELLERRQIEWARQAASLFPPTCMGRAARDALVLVLENDKQAANVLRLALPTFEEYHNRALMRSL